MELSKQQRKFTLALGKLIIFINERGYEVKIHELNRTIEQQRRYIKDGASKTKDSRHLDNLAADIVIFKDDKVIPDYEYRQFGERWEFLGGRWGGRFGLEDQPREVQDVKLGWDAGHMEFRKVDIRA